MMIFLPMTTTTRAPICFVVVIVFIVVVVDVLIVDDYDSFYRIGSSRLYVDASSSSISASGRQQQRRSRRSCYSSSSSLSSSASFIVVTLRQNPIVHINSSIRRPIEETLSSSPIQEEPTTRRRRRTAPPLLAAKSSSHSDSSSISRIQQQPSQEKNQNLGVGDDDDNDTTFVRTGKTVWEDLASEIYKRFDVNEDTSSSSSSSSMTNTHLSVVVGSGSNGRTLDEVRDYVQLVSLLRVGIPSLGIAASAKLIYPYIAMSIAYTIGDNNSGVFAVVAQDASQYIQNILTTSGLVFSLLVGQTYYFMYQQQEAIYLALFEEVSMAKSLLEQIALICQGRDELYTDILLCISRYVRDDLTKFNDIEPAILLSDRPIDDPLQDILFLTSVGEPSVVYQTIRHLRQARARRLGALQRKLPFIHMILLWILAGIVVFTFPLLGAGSQTIGGPGILNVQSYYLSFIVFGICLTMGIIDELQRPNETGAYNALTVLSVMVQGLQDELEQRISGELTMMAIHHDDDDDDDGSRSDGDVTTTRANNTPLNSNGKSLDPSIDSDGSFDDQLLIRYS